MNEWKVTLRPVKGALKILVENAEGDLLRARLPLGPEHPRALLTLLEGLSLWAGAPICAVISVGEREAAWSERLLFGGEMWPLESTMVHFSYAPEGRRRRRIAGLGDFRALLCQRGA
jgi:hypothetical protein